MTKNVGTIDKVLRIVVAIVLVVVAVMNPDMWWLGLIGIVPLATAFMGTCPLYSVFGMSTCPIEEKKK